MAKQRASKRRAKPMVPKPGVTAKPRTYGKGGKIKRCKK